MAIVTEISWDDMFDGKALPEHLARKTWRDAVAEIAEKAKAKLEERGAKPIVIRSADYDLTSADRVRAVFADYEPQYIVHCAAVISRHG